MLYNEKVKAGFVGVTVFGHSNRVGFDNFEFETEAKPEPLLGVTGSQG